MEVGNKETPDVTEIPKSFFKQGKATASDPLLFTPPPPPPLPELKIPGCERSDSVNSLAALLNSPDPPRVSTDTQVQTGGSGTGDLK